MESELSYDSDRLKKQYLEYKQMQNLRLSMYFQSVENSIPSGTPTEEDAESAQHVTESKIDDRLHEEPSKSGTVPKEILMPTKPPEEVKSKIQKDNIHKKKSVVEGVNAKTTETAVLDNTSTSKKHEKGKSPAVQSSAEVLPNSGRTQMRRRSSRIILGGLRAAKIQKLKHLRKERDKQVDLTILHSKDPEISDVEQSVPAIEKEEKKLRIEKWAKPYESEVKKRMEILQLPIKFREDFEKDVYDKIFESGHLENILPKSVIKKVLDKHNKLRTRRISTLEVDKQFYHQLHAADTCVEYMSECSAEYWKAFSSNMNLPPPVECPTELGASKAEYLEYMMLSEGIMRCTDERKRSIQSLVEVNRLGEVTHNVLKTLIKEKSKLSNDESKKQQMHKMISSIKGDIDSFFAEST